jgi:hypothetical protein
MSRIACWANCASFQKSGALACFSSWAMRRCLSATSKTLHDRVDLLIQFG